MSLDLHQSFSALNLVTFEIEEARRNVAEVKLSKSLRNDDKTLRNIFLLCLSYALVTIPENITKKVYFRVVPYYSCVSQSLMAIPENSLRGRKQTSYAWKTNSSIEVWLKTWITNCEKPVDALRIIFFHLLSLTLYNTFLVITSI